MKRKMITVVFALILILIIAGIAVAKPLMDKYSYSDEMADWDEFYQVSGEESAIILQDEMVEEKAIVRGGVCYFDLDTVHKYFNEVFYVDWTENLLLYTTATDTVRVNLGESSYVSAEGSADMGYTIAYVENEKVYVAADYVKLFTNYAYAMYDRHVQVYTEWGECQTAEVKKDTAVRVLGGIKSPILRELERGEVVEILNVMENWSEVKTSDSIIGYVENKRLINEDTMYEAPVTDYEAPEYSSLFLDGKVNLAFHAIGGVGGNDTLAEMAAPARGLNVIAPTWFSLNDSDGGYRSFGTSNYVTQAHNMGLQVWGVLDDFNYKNETGEEVDVLSVLSSTTNRRRLIDNVVAEAGNLGLDGINVDFEAVSAECGVHYVQFLRELSVECRARELVLSVDNYVPFNFNDYYRLDIQGQVVDYVVIMGYDEHWRGSGDPGSVASISYVSNGLDKTLEEVPAQKVVNALPLYMIQWRTEGTTVTDQYLTLNNLAGFLARISAQPEWDETTCQNYLEWQEGSATYQIWIEDAESISVKLNVMRAKDIGGVAVWRLGYDIPEIWGLLSAYVNS
ncbi:MAG: glycosyl hydrolase family 18 protein [Candidatus Gastranaerophilales bacterium]|nr:glycosyl hydrolase family 18 protein [Candidatus Gastranaerophilales bacterium]